MIVSKEIKCENCDIEFIIEFDNDNTLQICPFCEEDMPCEEMPELRFEV